MIIRGIDDLLVFLNHLKANHVSYRIARHRDDTIVVTSTLVG